MFKWRFISAAFQNDPIFGSKCVGIWSFISLQFRWAQVSGWLNTQVRFSIEMKSHTDLSLFRLLSEGTLSFLDKDINWQIFTINVNRAISRLRNLRIVARSCKQPLVNARNSLSNREIYASIKILQKWWKMLFISSYKLFSLSRYLNFCVDFLVM